MVPDDRWAAATLAYPSRRDRLTLACRVLPDIAARLGVVDGEWFWVDPLVGPDSGELDVGWRLGRIEDLEQLAAVLQDHLARHALNDVGASVGLAPRVLDRSLFGGNPAPVWYERGLAAGSTRASAMLPVGGALDDGALAAEIVASWGALVEPNGEPRGMEAQANWLDALGPSPHGPSTNAPVSTAWSTWPRNVDAYESRFCSCVSTKTDLGLAARLVHTQVVRLRAGTPLATESQWLRRLVAAAGRDGITPG